MWHFPRFCQSLGYGVAAGQELVLVACDLTWHKDVLNKLTVMGVDGDALRVVDIVDDQVALCAGYHSDIIAHAGCAALEVGQ